MKLVHVVPHLDDEAAGPAQSVLRLCEALVVEGLPVELHTMAAGRQPVGVNLVVHPQWSMFGRFGFSLGLISVLRDASISADVIHNHSLWSYSNMVAGCVTRKNGATLVTSPRGTLAPAARARSQLKKSLFKPIQWPAISRAACLHATSAMEYQDIREMGLKHPVAVIPNGIDIPKLARESAVATLRPFRRLLFLGRLHPIKGIELLLNAWRALQTAHPDWELVIAGKGGAAYVNSLHALVASLGLQRTSFPGPIYGEEKSSLYCSADLFILPTETENFGMAVAEALAHAVPVITTRGAPWSGMVAQQCGWWVERSQSNIVNALDQAMKMDAAGLKEMGQRGRDWMVADFDWASIARRMSAVYRWLREGGDPPACIEIEK